MNWPHFCATAAADYDKSLEKQFAPWALSPTPTPTPTPTTDALPNEAVILYNLTNTVANIPDPTVDDSVANIADAISNVAVVNVTDDGGGRIQEEWYSITIWLNLPQI